MTINPKDTKVWTRADMPPWGEVEELIEQAPWDTSTADVVLNAVVEHLNESGGVPAERHDLRDPWANLGAANKYRAVKLAERAESELARRNEELSEAQGEIALQKERAKKAEAKVKALEEDAAEAVTNDDVLAGYRRGYAEAQEKAEAERDEWKQGAEAEAYEADRLRAEVGRLTRELDDLKTSIVELQPAENRPTLDRQKIADTLDHHFGTHSSLARSAALSDLMALAPAEGWPEWLGPKPERLVAKRSTLGFEVDGVTFFGSKPIETYEGHLRHALLDATRYAAVIEAKKSEQAATEQLARRGVNDLAEEIRQSINSIEVGDPRIAEKLANDIVDAGWTPPESEDE